MRRCVHISGWFCNYGHVPCFPTFVSNSNKKSCCSCIAHKRKQNFLFIVRMRRAWNTRRGLLFPLHHSPQPLSQLSPTPLGLFVAESASTLDFFAFFQECICSKSLLAASSSVCSRPLSFVPPNALALLWHLFACPILVTSHRIFLLIINSSL